MADVPRSISQSSIASVPPSPSDSVFSVVDLIDSPSIRSTDSFGVSGSKPLYDVEAGLTSPTTPGRSMLGRPMGRPLPNLHSATAVNAEGMLKQARAIDANVGELQHMLIRISTAVEEARGILERSELQVQAAQVRGDLDSALDLVKKGIKAHVTAMQQEAQLCLRVPGCGVGTPTFHMRQTIAQAVKNKLTRRRDNALDLESRLNMGIRDTAKRRYMDVVGSAPTDDIVDRLCSPAPPECKLGTLTRREPQVDEKVSELLKEMEIRNALAGDTSKKLSALERELTFVIDVLEHDETAFKYELSVERTNRRNFCCCVFLAFIVFFTVVFVIPALAIYLP